MEREKAELEAGVKKKFKHFCYKDCYYRWVTENEMYLHYPTSGTCKKVLSDTDLPIPWYISNIWVDNSEVTISVRR